MPQKDCGDGKINPKNHTSMAKKEFIYKVKFGFAPFKDKGDDRKELYFGSITAIFSVFPEEYVGTNAAALWYHGLSDGNAYIGKFCTITAEPLIRNPQKR